MLSLIFPKTYQKIKKDIDNQNIRDIFIISQLKKLPSGLDILDAGCGKQPYKPYCGHLNYFAQDFNQYKIDVTTTLLGDGLGGKEGYKYGKLDYVSDICNIPVPDNKFDVILCTEVFEHIPYPHSAVEEFSRILKKDGILILTAPSNSLRHMDPFYFYSGFSDRWFEKILKDNKFEIEEIQTVGDYYQWISVEIWRTLSLEKNIIKKIFLLISFFYFYFKKSTSESINTLSMGYHIIAKKM